MNNTPFLTILTASYNNQETISKTLESISVQTYQNFEHIIIDNRSNDRTIEIIEKYKNKYQLKFISESDKGIADALNKGLKFSVGKYVLVIHADDYLMHPNTLSEIIPILISETNDIISFPVKIKLDKCDYKLKNNRPFYKIIFRSIIPHQGAFIHRRLHEKIGEYDRNFKIAIDYDFFYRSYKNKASFLFQNYPISIMEHGGLGSHPKYRLKRLLENFKVQMKNETNYFIHLLQLLYLMFFSTIYYFKKSKIK